tara:strand:- start:736 stop:1848 length:1113 start_codon:yes stop_codon:yes gene_type:complete
MSTLNRRNWLGLVGAGSVASIIDPSLPNVSLGSKEVISTYDYAKLNSNENPLGPSPKVRQAIIDAFDYGCRYPSAQIRTLAQKIAAKEGVTSDHIVITGGSTEGLKAAGLTFGLNGGEIITSDPVYRSLNSYAEQVGAYINMVPLDENMQQDLGEMSKRITNRTSLVFLCNPHNPSGALVPKNDLREFCDQVSNKTILFSDEAYYDYITEEDYPSMVNMVKEGKNVVVSRTFSKVYGLAGLRIGYLIARPDLAERMRANVMARTNILAVFAALACYDDQKFYDNSIKLNDDGKKLIYATLNDLNLKYIPSHTNFVFFHTGRPIQQLNTDMRKKGVAVGRPFPPLLDWCRISTGHLNDVKKFNMALKEVMA